MNITLQFKNIIDSPECSIMINDKTVFSGFVMEKFNCNLDIPEGPCTLTITHINKRPEDTVVENGVIVRDRSFELEKIIVDDYNIEELIWQSKFTAVTGEEYESCLFFGPCGSFTIDFYNPVLYWILKTRAEKNNNDPHWKEDYNYYQTACNLLKQISNK
jgi:hypothetical protein